MKKKDVSTIILGLAGLAVMLVSNAIEDKKSEKMMADTARKVFEEMSKKH